MYYYCFNTQSETTVNSLCYCICYDDNSWIIKGIDFDEEEDIDEASSDDYYE